MNANTDWESNVVTENNYELLMYYVLFFAVEISFIRIIRFSIVELLRVATGLQLFSLCFRRCCTLATVTCRWPLSSGPGPYRRPTRPCSTGGCRPWRAGTADDTATTRRECNVRIVLLSVKPSGLETTRSKIVAGVSAGRSGPVWRMQTEECDFEF